MPAKKPPELPAHVTLFGVVKTKEGWVHVKAKADSTGKIVSVDQSEGGTKSASIEHFKIDFGRYIVKDDGVYND